MHDDKLLRIHWFKQNYECLGHSAFRGNNSDLFFTGGISIIKSFVLSLVL